MDEIKFTVDGQEYMVKKPTLDQIKQSKKVYNREFNDALESGCKLRSTVTDLLKTQNLWDDDKQDKLEELKRNIAEKELVLHRGGIYKSQARDIAIDLRRLRNELQALFAPISNFSQHTAEGQAENAKFESLVSSCVVYTNGNRYFSSYEDYLNRATDPVAIAGAENFSELYYGLNADFVGSLPENQFLVEHKFADEQYRLIDKAGRLIDTDGRLIDEDGNLLDEDGNFVDVFGNKLDKDGNYVEERKPFLDDEEKADKGRDSAKKKKST